jgi:hypothetical protein
MKWRGLRLKVRNPPIVHASRRSVVRSRSAGDCAWDGGEAFDEPNSAVAMNNEVLDSIVGLVREGMTMIVLTP